MKAVPEQCKDCKHFNDKFNLRCNYSGNDRDWLDRTLWGRECWLYEWTVCRVTKEEKHG